MLIFTKIYSRIIVYKNDLMGEVCLKLYLPVVYILKFRENLFGGYSFMDMNMDVKDLFAKLKKGKSAEKKSSTGGGITGFFEKNPKMKIIIPVILIVISVAVALTIIFTTGKTNIPTGPADIPNEGQKVDILPEDVNFHEEFDKVGGDVFDEVDIANARVTFISQNSEGYYTAVVETKKASFTTLKVGDHINGSDWLVEGIDDNGVELSCNGKKIELKYNNGK